MLKRRDNGKGEDNAGTDEAKNWGYMRWSAIQSIYNELTENYLTNAVDTLWYNILRLYFKVEDNYAIVAHADPDDYHKHADVAIRYVQNIDEIRIILVANKRVKIEHMEDTWRSAREQLVNSMRSATNTSPTDDLYGIITVGHYSRYYVFSKTKKHLSNFRPSYVGFTGGPLHFRNDEHTMHKLLIELVQLTGNSKGSPAF